MSGELDLEAIEGGWFGFDPEIDDLITEASHLRVENERLRATIERLEIEKHNLAERLAEVEAASWKDTK